MVDHKNCIPSYWMKLGKNVSFLPFRNCKVGKGWYEKNPFPFFSVHSSNLSLLPLNYILVCQSVMDSFASVTGGNKPLIWGK